MVETLTGMAEAGADVVKIAMMPISPTDVADLLRATAEADAGLDRPVLGISMGRMGRASRILGGDFGTCATFAQMGERQRQGRSMRPSSPRCSTRSTARNDSAG